ncbi:myeloid-associated differentiation marker homolog [Chanos chanos]|uniref:Myeloid-associated differentiation marker homolog n=1 Tax=Chanos chanos TaxID=29144 RepID=A0A6J2W320_CHACN|nr:myeloid-associated differentiation marker homolog [Chanos chanos]
MPVPLGEISTLTTPLSLVRIWALVSSCLTFSLVAYANQRQEQHLDLATFQKFCMFSWCFFFILTFLILAITYIQFHNLLPFSWKNLTVTVAAMAALMSLAASLAFPWLIPKEDGVDNSREVVAAVGSCLTFLAYAAEVLLIRTQHEDQRGYMASVPGLLKVLQVFGGFVALLLEGQEETKGWEFGVSTFVYSICLLVSLGTILVMLGDCASRCPLPFDRLLAGFSLLGVLLYMVSTVICFTRMLGLSSQPQSHVFIITETVIACITLLAYTVDLAFSVKLLCDRS